jgi:hypothetical protein
MTYFTVITTNWEINMGWYQTIKKINGHSYLYRQRTYRVAGKVKTESQYIGPAAGDGEAGKTAILYHGARNGLDGSPVPSDAGNLGAGFYLAPKERAEAFSKFDPKVAADPAYHESAKPNYGGEVIAFDLNQLNLKTVAGWKEYYDMADEVLETDKGYVTDQDKDELREQLEEQGYDGIEIRDKPWDGSAAPETVIFPNSVCKLKQTMPGDIERKSANKKQTPKVSKPKRKRGRPKTPPRPKPANHKETFRVQRWIRNRKDISFVGMQRENTRVEKLMRNMAIDPNECKPLRIWPGHTVKSVTWFTGYFVMGPPGKHRTAFRKEIRRAHAKRWLDGLKKSDRARYKEFKKSMKTCTRKNWDIAAIDKMGEMIGSGYSRTSKKYAKEHFRMQAILKNNYKKYRSMGILHTMSGAKRKQRLKCLACVRRAKVAKSNYEQVKNLKTFFN